MKCFEWYNRITNLSNFLLFFFYRSGTWMMTGNGVMHNGTTVIDEYGQNLDRLQVIETYNICCEIICHFHCRILVIFNEVCYCLTPGEVPLINLTLSWPFMLLYPIGWYFRNFFDTGVSCILTYCDHCSW